MGGAINFSSKLLTVDGWSLVNSCHTAPNPPGGGRCPKKEVFLRRHGASLCRDPSLLAACASHSGRDLLSRCGRSGEFPSRPGDTPDSHRQNLLTRLLLCTVAQVVLLMLQCTVTVMPEFSWRHTMCGRHLYAMMMVCAHAPQILWTRLRALTVCVASCRIVCRSAVLQGAETGYDGDRL